MLTKPKTKQKEKLKFNSMMMKEVYEDNFIEEIERLGVYLDTYKFIAMVGKNNLFLGY
jgi:hypothetical protein